jgi:hypothetical protein
VYPLRIAVIDLDTPPKWFAASGQAADHMTADQARQRVGTHGRGLHSFTFQLNLSRD